MGNVPALSYRSDLVNTSPSSAQLQSPPLPTALLCACERSMLLAQDKQKKTSSGRGQTRHKSSWERHAILMRNTDERIPAFSRILGISRLSVRGLHSSAILHSMRISRAPQTFLWQIFQTETDAVLRHLPALVLTDNNRIYAFSAHSSFPSFVSSPYFRPGVPLSTGLGLFYFMAEPI